MKKFYLHAAIIFLTCFSSQAQWTQALFNNSNVTMLKHVNNVCFAYGIDNNSFQGKLYRSNNNGNTWTAVDSIVFKFIYVKDITYDSAHSNYVICTTAQNGIFVSADGNSWASTGIDWSGDAITYISNKLILTTANPDAGVGISTDGGYSFFSSNSGLVYPYYAHNVTRINNTLYIAMQGPFPCYFSNNAGASWTAESNGLSNFVNCFYKFKNNIYTGTYLGGVKGYNANTGSWKSVNKGLPSTQNIWALSGKDDSLFCGGDTIGVWFTTNGLWANFSSGLPAKTTVRKLLQVGKSLFAATTNGLWKIKVVVPQAIDQEDISDASAEKSIAQPVKVFPTITSGKLTIQSSEIPETISLININGVVIKKWLNISQVNIGDVPAGNYFICITVQGKLFTEQVIKTN